ncbi:MAG: flagellar hook-length control protein FliK [Lachnospiraceae bacterium]|nr:flagellar hook-length control protein FliK [Lachnospiraceae bacterium]
MTSSTVKLHGISGAGSFAYPTPQVQGNGGADFGQFLENATAREDVQPADAYESNEVKAKEAPVEEVSETEQPEVRDVKEEPKGVTESQKPDNVEVSEEDLEEAMEVIQTSVLEIQQMLCEKLGMSQEELMQALDALGMTELDMLTAGNVTKLALYAEGQNEMALLTNEELYNMVQDLEATMAQMSDELMEGMQAVSSEDADGLMEQALKALNDMGAKESAAVTVTGEAVTEISHKENDGEQGQNPAGENMLMAGQNVDKLLQAAQNTQSAQEAQAAFDMEQTRMIMDQIMERMNIRLNAEETSLEMQLHPEELGNLHITISAKEGVMTAQFTAESEAVRAVLENQIMQLQSKLDQQNIKVEAIEISVATHGFEQNLEQGRGNENSYQEEEKKSPMRRIDLSSLDAVDELPEEDQVVADMMQLHGNRVDYMA